MQIIPYTTTTAIGASTGEGGGGSAISSEVLFQTGDVLWLDTSGVRSGWVRDNGRTVGSATSGAAERASADVEALFTFLWSNFSNTICAVSGSRGASAAADWAANKTITMPDKRGYAPGGLDDMGNSAASRFIGVPFASGDATTAGSLCGETTHALSVAELAVHTHINTLNDPGHFHTWGTNAVADGSANVRQSSGTAQNPTSTNTTGITITNASAGSNSAHNNTGLRVLGTFYRKL